MKGLVLILSESETYVRQLFKEHAETPLIYHNLQHTLQVVSHSAEIALQYHLSPTEHFILMTAAWFHDTGHLVHSAEGHELASIRIMREHLENFEIDEKIKDFVEQCILDTRMPSHPQTITGKILCDADLYHLGTPDFFIYDTLVKKEVEMRNNIFIQNWPVESLRFLQQHSFFTSYCQQLLKKGKENNIDILQRQLNAE